MLTQIYGITRPQSVKITATITMQWSMNGHSLCNYNNDILLDPYRAVNVKPPAELIYWIKVGVHIIRCKLLTYRPCLKRIKSRPCQAFGLNRLIHVVVSVSLYTFFSCDLAAQKILLSVGLSHLFFTMCLSSYHPEMFVISMQKVKVRGQRSRSQE